MSGPSLISRILRSLALAAAVVCCGAAIRADGPSGRAGAALRQRVDRLLVELDAETRSVRAAARESLLALGPAILPLLPDDTRVTSAAARDAVRQIRIRLERESALATLAATQVTLRGRFPLGQVLSRITEQTGNRFDVTALDPVVLLRELQADDQSRNFWSACDDVVQQAGLAYGSLQKPGTLKLWSALVASNKDLAVVESGAFRVAVRSAALRPGFGKAANLLRIDWSLQAEPRLRPLFASIEAKRLLVTRAGATVYKPATPTARWELSMGEGAYALRLNSDFEVPSGIVVPTTVEFHGSLGIEMAAGPHQFVFDDLTGGGRETRRAGTVTVGLRSVEFPVRGEAQAGDDPGSGNRQAVRIEISLAYDQGGPAFESYRTWMYHNEAALESKSGRRIAPRPDVSTRQQGDGSVAVEYNFADVHGTPRDYRFLYVAPTLITQVPVEFRFPKIPVARGALEGTKQ